MELTHAIKQTNIGKPAYFDGVCPEFVKHLGSKAINYLVNIYNEVQESGHIPDD